MKRTILILIAVMTLLMCGCERSRESNSGDFYVEFYVDPETKVEYVLYNNTYAGGLSPRYNADGSLYIQGESK